MDKIEKIRQEIERRKNYISVTHFAEELLSFLSTLSEEPDKGLDVTDFCKPIDPGIAQCVADHWHEMLGEEEPDKSLEEAAKEYVKDIPTFKDSCLMKAAFEDGWLCSKEQMLKDAVEGEIQMRYSGCLCAKTIRTINEDKFKLGEKVRIIIVKEEEK